MLLTRLIFALHIKFASLSLYSSISSHQNRLIGCTAMQVQFKLIELQ
jgi:hypothetical protein